MSVNTTMRRWLAYANVLLYLLCAVAGGFVTRPAQRDLVLYWREPVAYLPDLDRSFLIVGVLLCLVVFAALATGRALAAQRPSRPISVAVWVLTSLLILKVALAPEAPQRSSAALPRALMLERLDALSAALKAWHGKHARYPEDAATLPGAPSGPSPWVGHGRRLPLRVVSETGLGPRLQGRPGDLAGVFYYVVSPTKDDYWLTAVVLDGAPTGTLDFLRDAKGRPLIRSSRPSSIRDDTLSDQGDSP